MAFGLGVGDKILVIFVVKVLCSALSNIAFFANNFSLFNAKNKLKLVPFYCVPLFFISKKEICKNQPF